MGSMFSTLKCHPFCLSCKRLGVIWGTSFQNFTVCVLNCLVPGVCFTHQPENVVEFCKRTVRFFVSTFYKEAVVLRGKYRMSQ